MFRSLGPLLALGNLLAPMPLLAQAAEHPLVRPNSYGWSFEGPALSLECVALLKTDPSGFARRVRERSPEQRAACLHQLVESLSPEPDFTAAQFEEAMLKDPNHNPVLPDPEAERRMGNRIGVNLNVSEGLVALVREGVIDDPGVIAPLIRCLSHPIPEVARNCHESLFRLTWHADSNGDWDFFVRPSATVERRDKIIRHWTEWESRTRDGHPLFDDWLKAQVLKAAHDVGENVDAVLKNAPKDGSWSSAGIAASYIDAALIKEPRLYEYNIVFQFVVGDHIADNWPPSRPGNPTIVEAVGLRMLRPNMDKAAAVQPIRDPNDDGIFETPGGVYTEAFPALDLTVQFAIRTGSEVLRNACLSSAKEGLAGLRAASASAALPNRGPNSNESSTEKTHAESRISFTFEAGRGGGV